MKTNHCPIFCPHPSENIDCPYRFLTGCYKADPWNCETFYYAYDTIERYYEAYEDCPWDCTDAENCGEHLCSDCNYNCSTRG